MRTRLASGRSAGLGPATVIFVVLSSVATHAQVINTFAGSGIVLQGVGGPATGVDLQNPYYLALDRNNNLYVSDRLADAVFKITPSGTLTRFAGSGVFGFSGDGGPATQAIFRYPLGLTFDASGNTYIADAENDRVREVTPAGTINTIAGGGSTLGDGGPAASAGLAITTSATIGPGGLLYIADTYDNLIRTVDSAGTITTIAGIVPVQHPGGFSGDGGPATQAQLSIPTRVVFDSLGNMYICDSHNGRIRKVTTGGIITTFVGGGSAIATNGASATAISLSYPNDISIDSSNNLYVPDTDHHLVLEVSPAGIVTIIAGTGGSGFSGDGGPATSARLWNPASVVVDGQGNIFIADQQNARVRRVDASGTITTWAGNGVSNYGGDGGPALQALLDLPQGVAFDPTGNLLIADVYNNRIRKVDTSGIITTIAGTGTPGYSGDNGQASLAELNLPQGVAADSQGNIYIADTENGVIRKIDSSGIITTFADGTQVVGYGSAPPPIAQCGLVSPVGLSVDQAGTLYIADIGSNCVSEIGADRVLIVLAGNGTQGYGGDGGPAVNAILSSPQAALPDANGGLYIADSLNSRVRYIDASGNIQTVAGTGVSGFGQPNGTLAVNTNIEDPVSLALGLDGSLYFGSTGSGPLLRIAPDGVLNPVISDYNAGFVGDGGPAIDAETNRVWGLAADANGDLYLADQQNYRIRKVTLRTLALSTQTLNTGGARGGSPANNQITVSNTGEGVLKWMASVVMNQGSGWLSISASSGTAPSTVTITADPGSLAAGVYTGTVTFTSPAATGSPAILQVTFTIDSYTISGAVTQSGSPVSGVTIVLSPGSFTTTDATGDYSFAGTAAGGPYTITPSNTGYIFVPPSLTIDDLTGNQTASFAAISITETTVYSTGAPGWSTFTAGAATVAITTDEPRSGDGSLRLAKVAPTDAAQVSYTTGAPLGAWGDLTALSVDYFIAVGVGQHPTVVLRVYSPGDSRSFFAAVDPCSPAGCSSDSPVGSWQTLDAINGPFQLYSIGGNPTPTSVAAIPADAPVYSVQVWSPYANALPWTAYVDNLTIAFDGIGQTFNFELLLQMQAITFGPLSDQALGSTPPALSATASSGLTVTFTSNTPNVCTVSGTTVTILISGGCSITATQAGNSSVAAAPPVTQGFTVYFSDVTSADYYYAAVDLLAQYGITAGCATDDFCATEAVTRAEMAIFMVRAVYGGDNFTASTTPYFTDVQPGGFGFQWIQKLHELGITSGCAAGMYCPNDSVTRDEMAIFIMRVRLGLALAGSNPTFTYSSTPWFTDVPTTDFAFPWVQRMKEENITSGCTATTYCPDDPVMRGEMAIFIMRGAFNQLLPPGTPVLTQISPATLAAGASGTYTITGANTNFVQGTTTLSPIPGVTIGTITVTSPTTLTVQLAAAANAVAQPYSILAITGTEEDVLPNGLAIQ
jgi:trimeric autotransporter adhesin